MSQREDSVNKKGGDEMSRKIMVLTMALVIVAVVALAVTSVAYAAGPQSEAVSGYPWVADAGHGEPGDGECDGGDENRYGPGPEGSGWGVPCDGTCDGGEYNKYGPGPG